MRKRWQWQNEHPIQNLPTNTPIPPYRRVHPARPLTGLVQGSIETDAYALKDFKNRPVFSILGEVVRYLAGNGIEESVMALHSELLGNN